MGKDADRFKRSSTTPEEIDRHIRPDSPRWDRKNTLIVQRHTTLAAAAEGKPQSPADMFR